MRNKLPLILSMMILSVSATTAVDAQIVASRIGTTGPVLPANTLVYVSLNSNLTSKRAAEGDTFEVTVTRPVIVGEYVVIPQGTLGHGRITWRTGKAVFGKSAKMTFELTDLQIGNETIPLTGHYNLVGKGNTGWTLGAVFGIAPVAGFFVTGHSAEAFQGTEFKAFTSAPAAFTIADAGTPAYYPNGGSGPVNYRTSSRTPTEAGKAMAAAQLAANGFKNPDQHSVY